MKIEEKLELEETLDPEDWDELRRLGHRMVDDLFSYQENIRESPVWEPVPDEIKAGLQEPLPLEPQGAEATYREFLEKVFNRGGLNAHPRFWAWVMGTGSPSGMLAEMLAAGLNPNMGGGEHVAVYVEHQVLAWCKTIFGFPGDSSGLLVSGASMANLVGLAAARNTMADGDVRKDGLAGLPRRMVLYGSGEMHSSIQKAVELLGLGSDALRKIPVDENYRIDIPALETALQEDRSAGYQPFCVVGNAGTVNTGAFDDLARLAEICRREGLWFHVDGAFGAWAALPDSLQPLIRGMEQANSLAFDLHKWMYMPFEIACVLVRNEGNHYRAFSLTPDYLSHGTRGIAAGKTWFSDYGIQLSRGFRALKAWMLLKEHGIKKYARLVEQNVAQARYLAALVEASPELEVMAPVPLNIVCFRYNPGGLDDEQLNRLNEELLARLHESGVAAPSYSRLNGQYVLRAAITNHRSRREDFDLMVSKVVAIGRDITGG